MTRLSRFEDAFWVAEKSDFNNTGGFDTLCKRLKDGTKMCKDFEEFLKQRAKIEDEYTKALQKLVKSAGGNTETGTLKDSWDSMVKNIECVGFTHSKLANNFNKQVTVIHEFTEKQKASRKQTEDDVKKQQSNKQTQYKKTMDAKKQFETKCKSQEEAALQYSQAKMSPMSADKEKEKLLTKKEKCDSDVDKADTFYLSNLKQLEEARKQWEMSMDEACKKFQQQEEERIGVLREEMWEHLNLASQSCVDDDESYEEVRKVLENCDIQVDIISFINEKTTGSIRPAEVTYVNYRSYPGSATASPGRGVITHAGTFSSRPPPPLPNESRSARTLPPARVMVNYDISEDSTYASIDRDMRKVIEDYVGTGHGELKLQRDDIVCVTGGPHNGLLDGHLEGTNRRGVFPERIVTPVSMI